MRRWFIFSLMLALWSLSIPALAGEAIRITGESGLLWLTEANLLTVEGQVRVEYQDIYLQCQRLVVDTQAEILEAFGTVQFRKGEDQVNAAYLRYNLQTDASSFRDVTASLTSSEFTGEVYLQGAEVWSEGEQTTLQQASFSGCDLSQPHYHLTAAEIQIFDQDKLVARQVTYYEGKQKLFYLPYLVVSLKDNRWEAPKVGYNAEDGWYLKTTYNYYRNPNWFGALFLDYYQLKGWGTGFKHQYNLAGPLPATGWLYFYAKENGELNLPLSLHTAVTYRPQLPEAWKGEVRGEWTRQEYQGQLRQDWASQGNLSWNQRNQVLRTGYQQVNRNPQELYTGAVYQSTRGTLAYENRPRKDLRYAFSGNFNFQDRVGLPREEPASFTQARISQDLAYYTLDFKAEQRHNPSYTLLPEVKLTTKPLRWGGRTLPLRASVSASRVYEDSLGPAVMKAAGQLNLTGMTYRLNPQTYLQMTGGIGGNYYDTNHGQVQANTTASLVQQLGPGLRNTITHSWMGRLGVSPLAYDLVQPKHQLRERLEYTSRNWRASLTGTYDLVTTLPGDLTTEVSYRHGQAVNSTLQLTYALPAGVWSTAKYGLTYTPNQQNQLRTTIYYDFQQAIWQEIGVQAKQQLTPLWSADIGLDWDGQYGGRLRRGRIGLTRDWHCRELRLAVDAVREEIWVELLFKLFPGDPLRLGATESQLLLDLNLLGGAY